MRSFLILFLITTINSYSQTQSQFYKIGRKYLNKNEQFYLLNSKGDTLKQLTKHSYNLCFTNEFENFAVFGIRGKQGWFAIDTDEKILFEIHNRYLSEISPDFIVEGKIRIIENGKVGFADQRGRIIIKPKFESVTEFSNGFAIIAENCRKVPCHNEKEHSDCQHFSIECKLYGYIDVNGKIHKLGNYTFDEIKKEINWKAAEEF